MLKENVYSKIDAEIGRILSLMLVKDPFKRPNAPQLLEELLKGNFKNMVEEAQLKVIQNVVKEKPFIPYCNENQKIKNHRCLFDNNPNQNKQTVNFQGNPTQKSIFEIDSEKQSNEVKGFLPRKKPQLLFDAKCPELFPVYQESIINPKKSRKRGKMPNFTKVGNILDMINVKGGQSPPKSPAYWKNMTCFDSEDLFKKSLQTKQNK
jgi:hypothetical protein